MEARAAEASSKMQEQKGATGSPDATRIGKRQPESFASVLPSTGLDILLVGPSHLCQALGTCMLGVRFDGGRKRPRKQQASSSGAAAIEALRRHVPQSDIVKMRHIQMVETLQEAIAMTSTANENSRRKFNHVVLIVSPTNNVEASKASIEKAASLLHDDYVFMQRLSIVIMNQRDRSNPHWESLLSSCRTTSKRKRQSIFASTVPVFHCQSNNKTSCLVVSRMLLQRATLSSRMGSHGASPLLFSV